jgi:hypothetical protein
MKRMLLAIMAVAVAVTFSAPSFAEDAPKDKKKEVEKPKFSQMLNADSDKDKKPKEEAPKK